jgi:nicotinamide-nucleotide amidase
MRDTTVPDDRAALDEALRGALARADLVFISGGLGPTEDDLTREVVAALAGRGIVMHEPSRRTLQERFARTGRTLDPIRERQTLIVEGAEALPNSVGAAPGARLEWNGKVLFMLPGPPHEFGAVLDEHVMPWLIAQRGGAQALRERVLMVNGLGESDIVQRFVEAGWPLPGIDTAYCAAAGRVEIRLHARELVSDEQLDEAAARAAVALGEYVYAHERIHLEHLIGTLLTRREQTLATAESCTGGLIGERLTRVHGSSHYYLGGVIAYADRIKSSILGVSEDVLMEHGAVSKETVCRMADGVRALYGADYGLAVTGIAGPSGGTADKPVGTVYIAVSEARTTHVEKYIFPGDRELIREWTCQSAMNLLRRSIGMRD